MTELSMVLIGGAVSAITQLSKKYLHLNPLLTVAILSLILGLAYSFLMSRGIFTEEMLKNWATAFGSAVTIYNILKEMAKKDPPSSSAGTNS